MSGGGLQPGSPEWLMSLRVFYAKDAEVVRLLELCEKQRQELNRYKAILQEEINHGS